MKKGKAKRSRLLCGIMAAALAASEILALTPPLEVKAAESTSINALKAIGINSDAQPEGFDEDDTENNPYGTKTVIANMADEVFAAAMGQAGSAIIGNQRSVTGTDLDGTENDGVIAYRNGSTFTTRKFNDTITNTVNVEGTTSDAENGAQFQSNFINKTAGGNFDGNLEGKKRQFAMVSLDDSSFDYDAESDDVGKIKLKLSVSDAADSTKSSDHPITLGFRLSEEMSNFQENARISERDTFGNYKKVPAKTIHQLQAIAYMSIVTGDFDGNGIDEIAVYNPYSSSVNAARVEIYGLKTAPNGDNIYDMNNWEMKQTMQTDGDNFVSLAVGDLDADGIDDLAIGCNDKVTVLFGNRVNMLNSKKGQTISCEEQNYSSGSVKDPSVVIFQEEKEGVSETYLAYLSTYDYYSIHKSFLNVYQWDADDQGNYCFIKRDGTARDSSSFNPEFLRFENYNVKTGSVLYMRMPLELYYANHHFWCPYWKAKDSSSTVNQYSYNFSFSPQNNMLSYRTQEINPHLGGDASFGNVVALTKNAADINTSVNSTEGFFPYDFQVADLNGDGIETVFCKAMVGKKYGSYKILENESTSYSLEAGHLLMATTPGAKGPMMRPDLVSDVNSTSVPVYAIVNTDDDTTYMSYTGRHSFTYTDPEVLAVLSSPPYFKDLLANDELTGNYAESTTSYGKSSGSGQSASASATISAGAFTRVEQEISILGLGNVAQVEGEVAWNASFTTEFEKASEISYSTEYSTSSGADAVVFYSIPMEVYEYDTTVYNKDTGKTTKYKKYLYFPKTPCTSTIELDKYNAIAKNYSELPVIGGEVLKHTLGYPETYPSSTAGYKNVKEFKGNWLGVDFTSTGGGITQTQSIEMSEEDETSFSSAIEMSVSSGAGAGGVTVGVSAGAGVEAGYAMISTSGNTYTATMQNMPQEAEEYGYGMSWKMFAHEGSYTNKKGDTVKFPVVDYMVRDVMAPPVVPEGLRQNYFDSSTDSIALEWDYEDAGIESFNVYRVTTVDGAVSEILAASVPGNSGVQNDDGSYTYSYTDDGTNADGSKVTLLPGIEYEYFVEAKRDRFNPPSLSMPSERIQAYTRSDVEYPDITVRGVTNNMLTVFPDRTYDIRINVNNSKEFLQLSYQWQKYDKKQGWTDIKGERKSSYTIEDANVEVNGEYRCRIDALAYDQQLLRQTSVRTYTDVITVNYQMRSVAVDDIEVTSNNNKPEVIVKLRPEAAGCMEVPTGRIKYVIENDSTQKICYAPLRQDEGLTASSRLSDSGETPTLSNGRYRITAYYEGDDIFGSFTSDVQYLVIGNQTIYPVLKNSDGIVTNTFNYGDEMCIEFYRYTKDDTGKTIEEKIETAVNKFTITNAPGNYNDRTIDVTIDGESKTFLYNYTVIKRPVEIGLSTNTLQKGEVEGEFLPRAVFLQGSRMVGSDTISDFVNLTFWNENKTSEVTLNNNTDVGRYHGVLTLKPSMKHKYYDITLYSSEINIRPKMYEVRIISAECDGKKVGTITLSKPEKRQGLTDETLYYGTNTELKLTAEPIPGYKLDHWEITADGTTKTVGDRTLMMYNEPAATTIKACYTANTSKVTIDPSLSKNGRYTTPDGFVSGEEYPVGTQLSFAALADDDVEPDYWIRKEGRKSYYTYDASLTLTIPEDDVILYPVFKAKSCEIEFGDGITATYTYQDENQDEVTQTLKNGYKVPKGATVNLGTSTYQHYIWYVNDVEIGRNEDGSFIVAGDSKIELRPIEIASQPATTVTVSENTTKVSDVELPENWAWDENDRDKELKRGEEVEAKAVYTGNDKDEYETTTIVIKITRSPCDHKNVTVFRAQEATCEEEGHIEYRICRGCGKIFSDAACTNEIKYAQTITEHSLGHDPVTDEAVESTCTKTGLTEGSHCSRCHTVFKAQKVVPLKDHTEVTDEAVPATCTEDGLTAGSHCSVCNTVIKEQKVDPKKGHLWDEGKVTKDPTETEKGIKTFTCTVCGATSTEDIPALGKKESSDPATGQQTDPAANQQTDPASGQQTDPAKDPASGQQADPSKNTDNGNTGSQETESSEMTIKKVTAKKNAKKITVELNVKDATVKIKVGKKAYKKAKAKGKTYTLKLGYKLTKGTKITVKVTKKKFKTVKKTYKVK